MKKKAIAQHCICVFQGQYQKISLKHREITLLNSIFNLFYCEIFKMKLHFINHDVHRLKYDSHLYKNKFWALAITMFVGHENVFIFELISKHTTVQQRLIKQT